MTLGPDGVPDLNDNDPVAARLRAALNAEADMVQPSDDSLHTIRRRIGEESSPWWRSGFAAAAAAVVVLLVGVGAAALLLGDDGGRDVVAGPGASSTTAGSPSPPDPTETPSASASTTDSELEPNLVWVYYVMDDPVSGPRLYREQHVSEADTPEAELRDAVVQMLEVPAADPDYSSPWAGSELLNLTVEGDTALVDVSDFVQVGGAYEIAAVQQLVHTVTANDRDVKRVRLLVDGEPPASGHADWSEPVSRAPAVETLGLIWLLYPEEGATAESPVKIVGYGTAFEGTVSWEVRAEGSDEVVAEGFTQAGSMGEFADFRDEVELEPGRYEIRAFESSAEDGRPLHVDDKTFTVVE